MAQFPWKKRLDPFSTLYSDMLDKVMEIIDEMSVEERAQLREDLKRPGDTNCAWYTFEVAKMIREMGWAEEAFVARRKIALERGRQRAEAKVPVGCGL